jgi:hypothetical protein
MTTSTITPEAEARESIDAQLRAAGWAFQNLGLVNSREPTALCEFIDDTGRADYVLYPDGKACGIIEAKRASHSLEGVQEQSATYAAFRLEANGRQIQFTVARDPQPRARSSSTSPSRITFTSSSPRPKAHQEARLGPHFATASPPSLPQTRSRPSWLAPPSPSATASTMPSPASKPNSTAKSPAPTASANPTSLPHLVANFRTTIPFTYEHG